ncbi:MAG TPA: hypothetical protein PKY70_06275, partial [Nakamurella multipartita]|nr:hypothetical protein [Nakamurella multipartita]
MPSSDHDPRWEAPASPPDPWPDVPPAAPGAVGEQPTTQLPRHPNPGAYPYPYPAPGPAPSQPAPQQPPSPPAAGWPSGAPAGPAGTGDAVAGQAPADRYRPAPRGSHLPPYQGPFTPPRGPKTPDTAGPADATLPADGAGRGRRPSGPKKLTVTRVAAFRSRELTTKGVQIFQRAATADGADRSGLTSLTYAVMGNYAVDAALAVALANTLFFAAAKAESSGKVLLYLLITVAPFAVIAPLIGPALDRLQHGRRIALAASSFARAVLAIVMAVNFDSWILYPCALGMLVLSKSFGVLKAAVTPRVLPPDITLVKTNSRLTVFGLLAGGVAGALAAALSWAFGSTGALIFTAILSVVGGWLCLRIPAWVESTAGEVPVDGVRARTRRAFPLSITTTLWANGSIRVETGFLALFIAFVIKSEYADASAFTQLLLLGVVGVAAGLGGFLGNAIGARLPLSKPDLVSIGSLAAVLLSTVIAALIPGLTTAAIVGLVGSTASSLAKVCLDSVIQHELPEASRASAFGVSETALQLSWVFGGVVGLLLGGVWTFGHDSVYTIGFTVVTVFLAVGLTQSWLLRKGRSLFPWLRAPKRSGKSRKTAADTTATMPAPKDATSRWSPPPPAFGQPPWATGPRPAGSVPAGPAGYPAAPGPA